MSADAYVHFYKLVLGFWIYGYSSCIICFFSAYYYNAYSINELLYSDMSVRVKKIVCKFTFKGVGGNSWEFIFFSSMFIFHALLQWDKYFPVCWLPSLCPHSPVYYKMYFYTSSSPHWHLLLIYLDHRLEASTQTQQVIIAAVLINSYTKKDQVFYGIVYLYVYIIICLNANLCVCIFCYPLLLLNDVIFW